MGRFDRAGGIAVLGVLPFVVACTSLGGPSPGSSAGLNLAGIDLASAVFAVDVPASVEAVDPPRVTYASSLDMVLVRADAEAVMGILPPPAEGRSYAVYAFSAGDQQKVRDAQATAHSVRGNALAIVPGLCTTPETKKDRDTVTVLAVLPGRLPLTVAGPETISALESRTGHQLAVCAGHSG